jgi:uncharacterized membrane protein
MTPQVQIASAWMLFGGSHLLLSSTPLRARLVERFGLRGFKLLYTVVAVATFGWLWAVYLGNRHAGPYLFVPHPGFRHVAEVVMLAAIVFLAYGHAARRPGTTAVELRGEVVAHARGIHRITRHPSNTAFALFGLAHLPVNPSVGDWIFWGGLVAFSVISAAHQDRRLLATGPPEFRTFHAETSALPFAAMIAGRQRAVRAELPWTIGAAALAVWAGLRLLHPAVIGGFGR